jgi:hypothetical protein
MLFGAFLKKLLSTFVEAYQTYFKKTLQLTLLLTVACFILAILLNAVSDYDNGFQSKPISILSFFFSRYSYGGTYSFVDMVKTIFIFFVSVFSISLLRNERRNAPKTGSFPFNVSFKDIIYLFFILIACFFLDVELSRLDSQLFKVIENHNFYRWATSIIFQLRIYLPLVLFSLIIQIRVTKTEFSVRKIAFLLLSLWLCNEVSYEFVLAVRSWVFGLVLSPVANLGVFYYAESILGVALIASLFAGYCCAMTAPFKIIEEDKASK